MLLHPKQIRFIEEEIWRYLEPLLKSEEQHTGAMFVSQIWEQIAKFKNKETQKDIAYGDALPSIAVGLIKVIESFKNLASSDFLTIMNMTEEDIQADPQLQSIWEKYNIVKSNITTISGAVSSIEDLSADTTSEGEGKTAELLATPGFTETSSIASSHLTTGVSPIRDRTELSSVLSAVNINGGITQIVTAYDPGAGKILIKSNGDCLFNSILLLAKAEYPAKLAAAILSVNPNDYTHIHLRQKVVDRLNQDMEEDNYRFLESIRSEIEEDVIRTTKDSYRLSHYNQGFEIILKDLNRAYLAAATEEERLKARNNVSNFFGTREKIYSEYIHRIMQPQSFGGQAEIIILSEALEVDILLKIQGRPDNRENVTRKSERPMTIYYNGIDHYDAILSESSIVKILPLMFREAGGEAGGGASGLAFKAVQQETRSTKALELATNDRISPEARLKTLKADMLFLSEAYKAIDSALISDGDQEQYLSFLGKFGASMKNIAWCEDDEDCVRNEFGYINRFKNAGAAIRGDGIDFELFERVFARQEKWDDLARNTVLRSKIKINEDLLSLKNKISCIMINKYAEVRSELPIARKAQTITLPGMETIFLRNLCSIISDRHNLDQILNNLEPFSNKHEHHIDDVFAEESCSEDFLNRAYRYHYASHIRIIGELSKELSLFFTKDITITETITSKKPAAIPTKKLPKSVEAPAEMVDSMDAESKLKKQQKEISFIKLIAKGRDYVKIYPQKIANSHSLFRELSRYYISNYDKIYQVFHESLSLVEESIESSVEGDELKTHIESYGQNFLKKLSFMGSISTIICDLKEVSKLRKQQKSAFPVFTEPKSQKEVTLGEQLRSMAQGIINLSIARLKEDRQAEKAPTSRREKKALRNNKIREKEYITLISRYDERRSSAAIGVSEGLPIFDKADPEGNSQLKVDFIQKQQTKKPPKPKGSAEEEEKEVRELIEEQNFLSHLRHNKIEGIELESEVSKQAIIISMSFIGSKIKDIFHSAGGRFSQLQELAHEEMISSYRKVLLVRHKQIMHNVDQCNFGEVAEAVDQEVIPWHEDLVGMHNISVYDRLFDSGALRIFFHTKNQYASSDLVEYCGILNVLATAHTRLGNTKNAIKYWEEAWQLINSRQSFQISTEESEVLAEGKNIQISRVQLLILTDILQNYSLTLRDAKSYDKSVEIMKFVLASRLAVSKAPCDFNGEFVNRDIDEYFTVYSNSRHRIDINIAGHNLLELIGIAFNNLSIFCTDANKIKEAEKYLDAAIEIGGSGSIYHLNKAYRLFITHRLDEAMVIFKEHAKFYTEKAASDHEKISGFIDLAITMSIAFVDKGDIENAEELLENLVQFLNQNIGLIKSIKGIHYKDYVLRSITNACKVLPFDSMTNNINGRLFSLLEKYSMDGLSQLTITTKIMIMTARVSHFTNIDNFERACLEGSPLYQLARNHKSEIPYDMYMDVARSYSSALMHKEVYLKAYKILNEVIKSLDFAISLNTTLKTVLLLEQARISSLLERFEEAEELHTNVKDNYKTLFGTTKLPGGDIVPRINCYTVFEQITYAEHNFNKLQRRKLFDNRDECCRALHIIKVTLEAIQLLDREEYLVDIRQLNTYKEQIISNFESYRRRTLIAHGEVVTVLEQPKLGVRSHVALLQHTMNHSSGMVSGIQAAKNSGNKRDGVLFTSVNNTHHNYFKCTKHKPTEEKMLWTEKITKTDFSSQERRKAYQEAKMQYHINRERGSFASNAVSLVPGKGKDLC